LPWSGVLDERMDMITLARGKFEMRSQLGIPISRALRAGVAALGLLLIGTLDHPRVDARSAAAEARIDAPAAGEQIDGVVEIRGRATVSGDGRFGYYRLLIGIGRSPDIMRPLGPPYDRPVENGLLATWDTDRFPSGEYLLTLQVYADDEAFESASALVTVKDKPTPTPMPIAMPGVTDVPTPVAEAVAAPAAVPVDAPPALDVVIPPSDEGAQSVPVLAPVPTIVPARPAVPIQPIPFDPADPGPFQVATPSPWSPGQLPFDPAPVYITPIDFSPPSSRVAP
jgi:hypothetical protein